MIKVYLAGPIRGLAYVYAVSWREYVADQLWPEITGYSPMRGKESLSDSQNMDERELVTDDPVFTPKDIVHRDFHDVRTCDLLFVNLLDAKQVSIGTVSEIAAAYTLQKPIILVMEEGGIHDHPFVTEPSLYWVGNLDKAIALTKMVLLP